MNTANVLITGGASGIGRELTLQLLRSGSSVLVMGRSKDSLANLKKFVDSQNKSAGPFYKGQLYLYNGDVTKPRDCENFVKTGLKRMKSVNAIIHCAGVGMRGKAYNFDNDAFVSIIHTNFTGAFFLYKAGRDSLAQTAGSFTALSSVQGDIPLAKRSAYGAAKSALNSFMQSLRMEDPAIHFCTVNLGYITTPFSKNSFNESGELYGKMDKNQVKGMPADITARKILAAIQKRKQRTLIAGPLEKAALCVNRVSPNFLQFILKHVNKDK